MASGTFRTPTNTSGGSGYSRYIYVNWSSTNNVSNNSSTITWHAYGGSDDSSTSKYVYAGPITVTINGTTVLNITNRIQLKKGSDLGSGTITVAHDSDGSKTVNVAISAAIYSSTVNNTYSGTITMTTNPVYSLSISTGVGSYVTVNRTLCTGYGSTGELTAGANKLCAGDILKVSFGSDSNYAVDTHTVNGSVFTSGNAHTVSGNVSVVATARALASQVGATDANVGSTSTITITKYNENHYHSLHYSFNGLSGYITSSGGITSTETRFAATSVPFTIPTTFYNVMPNTQSGTCTITCTTYESSSSSTVVGTPSTCTMTISVSSGDSAPTVTGTVTDTNSVTTALTGDSSVLIRYKSNALCTITATPKNAATIAAKYINNNTLSGDTYTYEEVATSSFTFKALDSRGYVGTATVTPTMIPYIPLTCNPVLARPTPTGDVITLSLTGNCFRGSFGAVSNTLTVEYRYKVSTDTSYGSWYTISSGISYNASSYYTQTPIQLSNSFDYRNAYTFQIRVSDGISTNVLSTVTQTATIQKGLPIFDWGETDFNINGTLKIFGEPVSFSGGKTIKYIHQTALTEYGDYLGDVSGDGSYDNADVIIMGRYVAGETPSTTQKAAAADINGDGSITQEDLDILNWFIVCGLDLNDYALARYDVTYTDNTTGKLYGGVMKDIISSGGGGSAGEDGGYYTPSVDASGNLTWTASKSGMPSVASSNIKGADGADGNHWYIGLNIHGTSTTDTTFPGSGVANAVVGDVYMHSSSFNLYRCTLGGSSQVATWVYFGNIKGASGATPNLTIGTVTTLSAGSNATASITGTTPNLTLNLGIPRGADGSAASGKVFYGSCSSDSTLAQKDITCETGFTLTRGVVIYVWFLGGQNYAPTSSAPVTLKVNDAEAIEAVAMGSVPIPQYAWRTYEVVGFVYTGTVWQMIDGGTATTTYYGMTKLSNAVNSTSEEVAATSAAVKAAYDLAATKTTTSDVNSLIAAYISNLDATGVSY